MGYGGIHRIGFGGICYDGTSSGDRAHRSLNFSNFRKGVEKWFCQLLSGFYILLPLLQLKRQGVCGVKSWQQSAPDTQGYISPTRSRRSY